VIRVRYQDISSGSHHGTGLHGTAKRCPQGVTIYLVPGLTGRQRKAVIRRLRQEASRGCGPELPLPGLIVALGADRVRVAVRLTAAAVRLHPATTLLPTGLVAIGMMLLVLASAGARPELAVAAGRAGTSHAGLADGAGNNAGDGTAGFEAGESASDGLGPDAGESASDGLGPGASDGQGPGGRGLVAGQRRLTTGRAKPRTARVCFGAMPGMAAQRSHLACRQTRSPTGSRAHPDSRASSG
jgi:hypothetical protein